MNNDDESHLKMKVVSHKSYSHLVNMSLQKSTWTSTNNIKTKYHIHWIDDTWTFVSKSLIKSGSHQGIVVANALVSVLE